MNGSKKKVLIVIAPKDYRDEEYFKPRVVLMSKGISIVTASAGEEEATGTLGGKAKIDLSVYKVKSRDYDGLVLVGGSGAKLYYHDHKIHQLIQNFSKENKVIAAICIAPVILANAGVLKGKKATCFPSERVKLEKQQAKYLAQSVVVDGKIVTAAGPDFAQDFGEAVAKAISK